MKRKKLEALKTTDIKLQKRVARLFYKLNNKNWCFKIRVLRVNSSYPTFQSPIFQSRIKYSMNSKGLTISISLPYIKANLKRKRENI